MLLILLVFCVVFFSLLGFCVGGCFFGGWETGVYVADLVCFLCCVLGMSILLILLVFCVVFWGCLYCAQCFLCFLIIHSFL